MSEQPKSANSTQLNQLDKDEKKRVDHINATANLISFLDGHMADAKALADQMASLTHMQAIVRERIVCWISAADDLEVELPEELKHSLLLLLGKTGDDLKRAYYTVGEKFTPINVDEEIKNVIPF